MNILLLVLILLQLLVAVIIVQTLFHPIIILKFFTTVSVFVLVIYTNIWSYEISIGTVFIITSGLLWVDLGFVLIQYINKKRGKSSLNKVNQNLQIEYSQGMALFFLGCIVLISIGLISYGNQYFQYATDFKSLSNAIMQTKSARRTGDIEEMGLLQYAITACTAIGFTYAYISFMEYLHNGFSKKFIIFTLPMLATLVLFFLTGRRAFLLSIFILIGFLLYEYLKRSGRKIAIKIQLQFVLLFSVLGSIFYSFFIFMGQSYEKTGRNEGFDILAVYFSGGIVAFDQVYRDYFFTSEIFGQNMFRIVYKILNIIPNANFPTDTINQSISIANGVVTNVYTVNLHYLADFGYAGVVIANIIIGIFFALLYLKSKSEKYIAFWNVLYAYFAIKLIAYAGSEKIFVSMVLNVQYIIFFIVLLKTPILRKRNKVKLTKTD